MPDRPLRSLMHDLILFSLIPNVWPVYSYNIAGTIQKADAESMIDGLKRLLKAL